MKASVTAHKDFTIAKIDDPIYSACLEHLGRAIYTGIYQPGGRCQWHARRCAELVRDLNISFVRYPSGNFVSAYCWEDGQPEGSARGAAGSGVAYLRHQSGRRT